MKTIEVNGAIVSDSQKDFYERWNITATAPKDIQLMNGEDVEVLINSGGGDVFAGSEIYSKLKNHNGQVTVRILGVAASAASVIAMSGDSIEMSPTSMLMIHNVSTFAQGDAQAFGKMANDLEKFNKAISNAYLLKTDKTQDELLELMNKETWMTADEALEHGFVDKVMFAEEAPVLVADAGTVVPPVLKNALEAFSNILDENKKEIDELKNAFNSMAKQQNTITEEVEEVDDTEDNSVVENSLNFSDFLF